jgi:hypothetical protein
MPSSPARIAMCELAPPNWVTNPLISRVKIQSKPGSALGTKRIRPAKLSGGSLTEATGAVTLFRVMKLGWLGGR